MQSHALNRLAMEILNRADQILMDSEVLTAKGADYMFPILVPVLEKVRGRIIFLEDDEEYFRLLSDSPSAPADQVTAARKAMHRIRGLEDLGLVSFAADPREADADYTAVIAADKNRIPDWAMDLDGFVTCLVLQPGGDLQVLKNGGKTRETEYTRRMEAGERRRASYGKKPFLAGFLSGVRERVLGYQEEDFDQENGKEGEEWL